MIPMEQMPQLMANMGDGHLFNSLGGEPRTNVERELLARCEQLVEELRNASDYESQLEQSEFRAQLITEILELCDYAETKRELIASIKRAVENSYVKL